ncbi:MAG: VOC family protein [Ilumatobacter sp.]|nr:VOC family protein [Ilumatobacter sp.]
MINGFHTIIYSDDAEATRGFLRDVLGWPSLDAGGGWLIFKTPPTEMGVHPAAGPDGEQWGTVPTHQVSLMCDDIEATAAELRAKGVLVSDEIRDEGFGLTTTIEVPGAGSMMLYEPRHGLAYELDG